METHNDSRFGYNVPRYLKTGCLVFALLTTGMIEMTPAAERVPLVSDGLARHQVVLPDDAGAPHLDGMLAEGGLLFRKAFQAQGANIEVVAESARDASRPGIFLGTTVFARQQGIDPDRFEGWSYLHRSVGENVIIIGRDHANPQDDGERRYPNPLRGARMGTAKGVADFLHDYLGMRFLYPAGDVGLEIEPVRDLSIPADLDHLHRPTVLFNFCNGFSTFGTRSFRGNYYLLANNLFPNADFEMTAHSYPRAIPASVYRHTHPEYFALLRGERMARIERLSDHEVEHYCLSNTDVQDLIYQDALRSLDSGFELTVIAQQDGFRPCQCEDCFALYDTGADWSEKLWIFQRKLAERLQTDRPDARLMLLSYGPTWTAPKSFDRFPDNVILWLSRTTPPVLKDWARIEVPGGYAAYLYEWGTYRPLGYTPQQTPLSMSRTVDLLHDFNVQGVYLDGFGHDIGLQAPVHYVYGRLLNNPSAESATEILENFYRNAFGTASVPMRRFFDTLFRALDYYEESPLFYTDLYGRERRHAGKDEPLRALRTVYAPEVLDEMETQLAMAESMDVSDAVRSRIALARLEFDYARLFATIAYLDGAYQLKPDIHSRERLLDAVDALHAFLGEDKYRPDPNTGVLTYLKPGIVPGWPEVRLFLGHTRRHIVMPRRYTQTPMAWDTEAMRRAPLPGANRMTVVQAPRMEKAERLAWRAGEGLHLGCEASGDDGPRLHAGYDPEGVFFVFTGRNPENGAPFDSVEVALDPTATGRVYYRFRVTEEEAEDAAFGLIDDNLHPLFGREDPSWTGLWQHAMTSDRETGEWAVTMHVPYTTLSADKPGDASVWRGNAGVTRKHADGDAERWIWTSIDTDRPIADPQSFSEIVFKTELTADGTPRENPATALRKRLYRDSFDIHPDWQDVESPIPGFPSEWVFSEDLTDRGEAAGWAGPEHDTDAWIPVEVPAFLAETAVGRFLGHGWYRTVFELPETWRGSPVELHFGAIDEQAWVYVNGTKVFSHSTETTGIPFDQLWDAPFTVTVSPELLQYGGGNVLAVKIHASVGNAGIWRPVRGRRVPAD